MKIYQVIWDDKRGGLDAYPFSTPEKAITFAEKSLMESAPDPSWIVKQNIPGWLWYATYGESSISVRETDLDKGFD